MQGELNLVSDKLKLTQGQVTIARNQVKKERADYTKKLGEVESTLATKASADDVKAIGTDVNGVKTDLDATKGNLQALRGEHGELIARNHEELEQLKRMGERDYFEFTLSGKGQKQHVGSMQVELRGASAKKHQFTVALYVDDMRLEKKNKAINEPIYFYTNGSHQAMELVVKQSCRQVYNWLFERAQGYGGIREDRYETNAFQIKKRTNERALRGPFFFSRHFRIIQN